MPSLKQIAAFCLTSTLLNLAAAAQVRVCIGGDLEHLSSAQRNACSISLRTVRDVAAALHAPEDWHFVVVCGEQGWKQYAAFSADQEPGVALASANTDLGERETFLRERDLMAGNVLTVTQILAHEVATVQLRTRDESAIRLRMGQLLEQTHTAQGM